MTEIDRRILFDTILNDYGNMVAKVCYMYGTNEEQRKDLYQECMANVWQGLKSFKNESKLSTWVYRACINTCITCYRRNQRHDNTLSIDDVQSVAQREDNRVQNLQEMYRLISQLNSIEKALIMMWLDEKSYDEISEVTGMRRNTVASRLKRIKEKLIKLGNS
ncbi:MAG: sigma-70 family RNA polymerase sigma factor [Muribaculaceae bacterium]|nr:sigma-70 family RNA polymerase sigma factor [Muribaculaceae bacterium]